MRYGTVVPFDEGWLPVFSVGSEAEAHALLTATCPTNVDGEFVARELVEEQTLDNLYAFGARIQKIHDERFKGTDRCACRPVPPPKTPRRARRRPRRI